MESLESKIDNLIKNETIEAGKHDYSFSGTVKQAENELNQLKEKGISKDIIDSIVSNVNTLIKENRELYSDELKSWNGFVFDIEYQLNELFPPDEYTRQFALHITGNNFNHTYNDGFIEDCYNNFIENVQRDEL